MELLLFGVVPYVELDVPLLDGDDVVLLEVSAPDVVPDIVDDDVPEVVLDRVPDVDMSEVLPGADVPELGLFTVEGSDPPPVEPPVPAPDWAYDAPTNASSEAAAAIVKLFGNLLMWISCCRVKLGLLWVARYSAPQGMQVRQKTRQQEGGQIACREASARLTYRSA